MWSFFAGDDETRMKVMSASTPGLRLEADRRGSSGEHRAISQPTDSTGSSQGVLPPSRLQSRIIRNEALRTLSIKKQKDDRRTTRQGWGHGRRASSTWRP